MSSGDNFISGFKFRGADVYADISEKYGYTGPMLDCFYQSTGAQVHKWHHYIPIYDRYFSPWRGKPLKFLEIGVFRGGSLRLWRNYFGDQATIFGIDIDPKCAAFNGIDGQVRIGSQADPEFLAQVVAEMGGVDIVLDDGSHQMDHIRQSLRTLFPHVAPGGLYMIEDLHTAYWPEFGGGSQKRENFFNDVRSMIDVMHRWYIPGAAGETGFENTISGMHVHDSIVVLEKGPVHRPVHSLIGQPGTPRKSS